MELSPSLKYRKLRIAWSVGWGVAAVLLLALWVRSYWRVDVLYGSLSSGVGFRLASVRGWTELVRNPSGTWRIGAIDFDEWDSHTQVIEYLKLVGPSLGSTSNADPALMSLPSWLPVLFALVSAGLAWSRYAQFSLRTLLIATTLIATLLGLIVWRCDKQGSNH